MNKRDRNFYNKSVCIVTEDFIGPVRNGGIGTAYTFLAQHLAQAGFKVKVLFALGSYCENESIDFWVEHYGAQGIDFCPLPVPAFQAVGSAAGIRSFAVYEYLKQSHFDIIHFHEWRGLGYYSLKAKQTGLAFQNTSFWVGVHSPTLWHRLGNQEYVSNLQDIEIDFMERACVEMADVVVSPSQYMLNWLTAEGWTLPEHTFVNKNIPPIREVTQVVKPLPIDEIVFFGRLEERKGVVLFCDAIERLLTEPDAKKFAVTFLGKSGWIQDTDGFTYLNNRTRSWGIPVNFLTQYSQDEALRYLSGPGRLALISSLIDNSPYTVVECLASGIPFLASNVGGVPELIRPADIPHVTFPIFSGNERRTTKVLAESIAAKLESGALPKVASTSHGDIIEWWITHHNEISLSNNKQNKRTQSPRISICLVHHNRPHLLKQAVASIKNQTYQNFEVILVDDGSDQPEAIAYLKELEAQYSQHGWQIIYQPNKYLGAARNTAARYASGEYLLFMDDDNLGKEFELEVFSKAILESGADILTCVMELFVSNQTETCSSVNKSTRLKEYFLPLGGAVSVGIFWNCFGDANACIRKSTFDQLGGFTEDYGVGHEDWEFFSKACLSGYRLEVIPEALFYYRVSRSGMLLSGKVFQNHMRSLRPYIASMPSALRHLVLLSQGMKVQNDRMTRDMNRSAFITQAIEAVNANQGFQQARAYGDVGNFTLLMSRLKELAIEAATNPNPYLILCTLLESTRMLISYNQYSAAQANIHALEKVLENISAENIYWEVIKLKPIVRTFSYITSDKHNREFSNLAIESISQLLKHERTIEEISASSSGVKTEIVNLLTSSMKLACEEGDRENEELFSSILDVLPFRKAETKTILTSEEVLRLILQSEDIISFIEQHYDMLTPGLVSLIQANAANAASAGDQELADGLIYLSETIVSILKGSNEDSTSSPNP